MKQTLFYLIALIICAATACAPKYSAIKLPSEQIIFGSGGGFVGIETSFLLLDNGQLFKKIGQDSVWAAIKSANKKIAKQYFIEGRNLFTSVKDTINDPSNTYSFLELRDKQTGENPRRFVWSRTKSPSHKSADIFYRALNLLVQEPKKIEPAQTPNR